LSTRTKSILKASLLKAKEVGLEKVELNVYASNKAAQNLYKKLGFQEEGLIKHFRKLDGQYFDCVLMGLFL
jgi:RimJ/RimL family protein N-acetyltransferase